MKFLNAIRNFLRSLWIRLVPLSNKALKLAATAKDTALLRSKEEVFWQGWQERFKAMPPRGKLLGVHDSYVDSSSTWLFLTEHGNLHLHPSVRIDNGTQRTELWKAPPEAQLEAIKLLPLLEATVASHYAEQAAIQATKPKTKDLHAEMDRLRAAMNENQP